jgi:2-polyprenyl-3-methyl-5-hydroxy-6-metoxy-1,4-benzoquinol methylase
MDHYQDRLYRRYVSSHYYYRALTIDQEYAALAPFYERNFRALLPTDPHTAILDIACGTGHFCYYLRQAGYTNITGIDLSPEMVAACQARGLSSVAQGEALDYLAAHPATFSLITANDFIEHLAKPRILEFLDAAMNALQPGGALVLKTPNAASLFGARDVFVDFTHEVGFTPESMLQVLHMTGFDHVRILPVRPAVGSWRGWARDQVWGLWQQLLTLLLVFEGRPVLRPAIVSASMLGVGYRPTDNKNIPSK